MPASYKDKLINYEVQPPTAAWKNISEELQKNNELIPVAGRLFNFEINPPHDSWAAIQGAKNEGADPIIEHRIKQKLTNPLYYIMSAAAMMTAIMIGIISNNQENLSGNKVVKTTTFKSNQNKSLAKNQSTQSAIVPDQPETVENTGYNIEPHARIRKVYNGPVKVLQNTKVSDPLFLVNAPGIVIAAKPIRNSKGEIIQDSQIMNNTDNPYISITSPNGQQTKISSKFLHMLLFINEDNDVDQEDRYADKNFLQGLIWKTRFQDWRNKIMNTALVPSSTNFMDILEFRDLIMMNE
jgi:hypothetical protein